MGTCLKPGLSLGLGLPVLSEGSGSVFWAQARDWVSGGHVGPTATVRAPGIASTCLLPQEAQNVLIL